MKQLIILLMCFSGAYAQDKEYVNIEGTPVEAKSIVKDTVPFVFKTIDTAIKSQEYWVKGYQVIGMGYMHYSEMHPNGVEASGWRLKYYHVAWLNSDSSEFKYIVLEGQPVGPPVRDDDSDLWLRLMHQQKPELFKPSK